jgi:hypothetical protein
MQKPPYHLRQLARKVAEATYRARVRFLSMLIGRAERHGDANLVRRLLADVQRLGERHVESMAA